MHNLTVTLTGAGGFQLRFVQAEGEEETPAEGTTTAEGEAHTEEAPDEGPSPIAPEFKELLWGFGAFFVFLALMRLFLVPKMRKGMQARRDKIRTDLETADATRLAAQVEVEEYQAQLVSVKAQAAQRIDAARQQLESERAAQLAQVNARIAERRSAAVAEADAALAQARQSINTAAGSVAARAVEVAVGKRPSADAVERAVADAAGVRS